MPAHPQLTQAQAARMVAYIMSLAEPRAPSLPVRGQYTPAAGTDSSRDAVVMLRATYTDRGGNGATSASGSKTLALRSPTVVVASGDTADGVQKYAGPEVPMEVTIGSRPGAFVGFRQLDLTGISGIVFAAMAPVPQLNAAGGKVEVRLDSPTGPLIGETPVIPPNPTMAAPSQLRAPLTPTTGMRDVYFVFKNDQITDPRTLLVLMTATFESNAK